jgi:hypothetical protein
MTLALSLALASTSLAAPSFKDKQEAQQLAAEGKKLALKGDFKKAAKKYKKADELAPSPSYKLELARLLIELDDFIQAGEVLSAAGKDKPVSWQDKKAQKDLEALAKEVVQRTPTLAVEVAEPEASKVTITVAGEQFEPADGARPFNPGSYEVVAKADGYTPFAKTIKLDEGEAETVEVSLKKGDGASASEGADETSSGGGISPAWAYVSWGVGAVGLGLGSGFGIMAIQSTNDFLLAYDCPDGLCKNQPGAEEDLIRVKTNGNISTAGFVVAGVGVVAGTILYLVADKGGDEPAEEEKKAEGTETSLRAMPVLGPGYLGVSGRF